jgi:signal transduction histidine kinase
MRTPDGSGPYARRVSTRPIRTALVSGVRRSDVVLAASLLALSLVQVLWVQPLGSLAVSLLVTVVAVVPLAWRRARPAVAAVVGTAAWLVPTDAFLFVGFVVAILLFFALGRWTGDWRLVALVSVWGLAVGTLGTLRGPEEPVSGLLSTWLAVLAPVAVGRVMRAQEHEAAQRLESEREATRLRAVEEERSRIVSELHDVLGHEVTLISIQSEAATQALELAPEQAAGPVAAVRETAQRASRELRAILGLLGHGELPVATDPRGLTELTDRAARLGIPTSLTLTGVPWPDAPQHWLAVNRIVQECLTNAGKHAPGERVDVVVDWADDGVCVRVSNPASGTGTAASGLGLPGMAERARLLGGTLDTAHDGGCFTVTAWLPSTAEQRP